MLAAARRNLDCGAVEAAVLRSQAFDQGTLKGAAIDFAKDDRGVDVALVELEDREDRPGGAGGYSQGGTALSEGICRKMDAVPGVDIDPEVDIFLEGDTDPEADILALVPFDVADRDIHIPADSSGKTDLVAVYQHGMEEELHSALSASIDQLPIHYHFRKQSSMYPLPVLANLVTKHC